MAEPPHTCMHQFGPRKHCCACSDCGRFEREVGWCVRCGDFDPEIGWNDVCAGCELILVRPTG